MSCYFNNNQSNNLLVASILLHFLSIIPGQITSDLTGLILEAKTDNDEAWEWWA